MAEIPVASPELSRLCVNTLRMLAVDAIEAANSGHPGLPLGAADHAFVLWTRFLRTNPADPAWLDRDRFVLSAGHGSMLLYALLHLSGFDLGLEDIKAFRQVGSRTPGHPEYGLIPGVETTTGPLGQGFANAVGMALAARLLAERVNTPDFSPVSQRVFGIVGDGDLMEGVASEAASFAGHLGLGNLNFVYDDNHITIEGDTDLAFSESVPDRFTACGWHVQEIDGHDHDAIGSALEAAVAETERPSLIAARTHIGFGSPGKQGSEACHGAPLGAEEVAATRKNLGWLEAASFHVPPEVKAFFHAWAKARAEEQAVWTEKFQAWSAGNPDQAAIWQNLQEKRVPENILSRLLDAVPQKEAATRKLSGAVLQTAAEIVPSLIGGSADLGPSNNTTLKSYASVSRSRMGGRNIHFGVREHAMGAIMNGMALQGAFIPYGGTFLIFCDYMRPAIRMAALMKQQVIYVFTHDSIFVGEDGPTHQPVEQISALRSIPGLTVLRPADAGETAAAWAWALQHRTGPTALVLTRQPLPAIRDSVDSSVQDLTRGGYVIQEADSPDLILVGTGSEVHVALAAASIVTERTGKKIRVLSMPSMDLFLERPASDQRALLPPGVPVVAVEAGCAHGWGRIIGRDGLMVGIERFGASGPWKDLAALFGLTPPQVAEKILTWMG